MDAQAETIERLERMLAARDEQVEKFRESIVQARREIERLNRLVDATREELYRTGAKLALNKPSTKLEAECQRLRALLAKEGDPAAEPTDPRLPPPLRVNPGTRRRGEDPIMAKMRALYPDFWAGT